MKKLSYLARAAVFLVVGILLFRAVNVIFLEKSSYPQYRYFKQKESVDVLILGNSHSRNGFDAQIMEEYYEEKLGQEVSVFNYSLYGMRVEQMRFVLKELLKTHVPEIIVVETYSVIPIEEEHREVLARRAFDVFPISKNKIDAVLYCTKGDYWSYFIPFMKYHSRWKELTDKDVKMLYDENVWGNVGWTSTATDKVMEDPDGYFDIDPSQLEEIQEITVTEKDSIEEILSIAKDNNIKVLFTSIPFRTQMDVNSLEMIKINNYLKKHYVDDENVQLLDMNRMWKQLSFGYGDLEDNGHCNIYGMKKVTNCLLEYMSQHYQFQGAGR